MNEQEIGKAASMYALVAEMEAAKARFHAMKAENRERDFRGESAAWPPCEFHKMSESLTEIASRLRREI